MTSASRLAHGAAAVAAADLRWARRSPRFWLFLLGTVGATLMAFRWLAHTHGVATTGMLSGSYTGPRYLFSYLGVYLAWFALLGMTFFGADVWRRDERAGIADVLHAKPVSNLAIIAGRYASLAVLGWLPVALAVGLMQALGLAAEIGGWNFAEMVEPASLFVFALLDTPATILVWAALVALVAAALRNPVAAWLVAATLLGLSIWLYADWPVHIASAVLPLAGDPWASDIVSGWPDPRRVVLYGAQLALAAGMLTLAAGACRRTDQRRLGGIAAGLLLLALAGAMLSWSVARVQGELAQRKTWRAVHESLADAPVVDLERVTGNVGIQPGDALAIDIELHARIPAAVAGEPLVFSLNPGMRVEHAGVDGRTAAFRHANGLLTVAAPVPLAAGARIVLAIRARGVPDANFAYLDSAVDWRRRSRRNRLALLGTDAGLFDERFVALMPATCWLPVPGANVERPPRSFFAADLTVETPTGWVAAGPGRAREPTGGAISDRTRWRFAPNAPVPAVGLVAAPFRRETVDIGGVEFALLMHPDHWRNVRRLQDVAGDAIAARVENLLDEAARLGIPYPHDALHLVEAPSRLRGYGGGWRLDEALALPGVLMLKEHGFPDARMSWIEWIMGRGGEAGVAAYLQSYFDTTYTDGRLLPGFVRNALSYQMGVAQTGAAAAAAEESAQALAFLGEAVAVNALTTSRWVEVRGFTAHAYDYETAFGTAVTAAFGRLLIKDYLGPVLGEHPHLDSAPVWRRAIRAPLMDSDGDEDPKQATYAMMLRGTATARAVADTLGTEGVAALFSELRRRHLHGHYDAEAFLAASGESTERLAFARAWLQSGGAPGFLVSDATARRVEDESGVHHVVRVHVRNDEPVPGVVRFARDSYLVDDNVPMQIPGNTSLDIAHIARQRPKGLYLMSYFSRNQGPVQLRIKDADEIGGETSADALLRVRPSAWRPEPIDGIVVDDLDDGFAARRDPDRIAGWLRPQREPDDERPATLPGWPNHRGDWAQMSFPAAWGGYRRTLAWAWPGGGAAEVSFAATLPGPRRSWRVYYHVPERDGPVGTGLAFAGLRRIAMRLAAGDRTWPIEFDASESHTGWNLLGEFPLGPGEVELSVSNRTGGDMVIADAVLWRPSDGGSMPVEP